MIFNQSIFAFMDANAAFIIAAVGFVAIAIIMLWIMWRQSKRRDLSTPYSRIKRRLLVGSIVILAAVAVALTLVFFFGRPVTPEAVEIVRQSRLSPWAAVGIAVGSGTIVMLCHRRSTWRQ